MNVKMNYQTFGQNEYYNEKKVRRVQTDSQNTVCLFFFYPEGKINKSD